MSLNKLPSFPNRIFLDTNVVQFMNTFSEYIFDNYFDKDRPYLGKNLMRDIESLRFFIQLGHRNSWPLVVSRNSLSELLQTPEPNRRASLSQWAAELRGYFLETNPYEKESYFSHSQRQQLDHLLNFVPQEGDRKLLMDAKEFDCDFFLTVDYKTIIRYKTQIHKLLGLNVMSPTDMINYLKPWIGFLR